MEFSNSQKRPKSSESSTKRTFALTKSSTSSKLKLTQNLKDHSEHKTESSKPKTKSSGNIMKNTCISHVNRHYKAIKETNEIKLRNENIKARGVNQALHSLKVHSFVGLLEKIQGRILGKGFWELQWYSKNCSSIKVTCDSATLNTEGYVESDDSKQIAINSSASSKTLRKAKKIPKKKKRDGTKSKNERKPKFELVYKFRLSSFENILERQMLRKSFLTLATVNKDQIDRTFGISSLVKFFEKRIAKALKSSLANIKHNGFTLIRKMRKFQRPINRILKKQKKTSFKVLQSAFKKSFARKTTHMKLNKLQKRIKNGVNKINSVGAKHSKQYFARFFSEVLRVFINKSTKKNEKETCLSSSIRAKSIVKHPSKIKEKCSLLLKCIRTKRIKEFLQLRNSLMLWKLITKLNQS